ADLTNANLKLGNLGEAFLKAACLNDANLTEVLAIGTNFTTAQMSGTCLEAWNIDHTTILDNVESKYIYLLEEPKPETDDRERRPSSRYFQKGDFTKLFQEVLNTVDLIFRDGVDAKAFMSSFKQVQVENQGIPMKIQSMENKGDGVVVIRIDVPPETEKEKIHRDFIETYNENVRVLDEKYQKKLQEIKRQINQNIQESERKYQIELAESERKHQIELAEIKKQNARSEEQKNHMMSLVNHIFQKSTSSNYLVTLNFEAGNFETGFPVIRANIWSDSHPLPISFRGNLTPKLEIPQLYQDWREKYEQLTELHSHLGLLPRIKMKKEQTTNFSKKDIEKKAQKIISQIRELEKEWRSLLNNWLNDPNFNRIEKELRTRFNPSDKVRLIIQSEDILIQRIPWHLWNFFSDYKFAETAIGLPEAKRVEKFNIARGTIRILAIFGDDKGINIEADKQYLSSLSSEVEVISLVEPSRQKLDEKLWDEKGWDIICFSGHSQSKADGSTGCFYLGNETKMTIEELEQSLTTAISKGLQLAIFNSCDGLGLARQLARLHIPAIIVMREQGPDIVTHKFLQDFLELFASGKSLYISVRQAREKLQVIEDKFPGASWLPVICQNSAEIPPSWESLQIFHSNFEGGLTKLLSSIETEKFTHLTSKQKSLLQHYYELTNLSELSKHETEQMEKILERAESDDLLNYWIEKIDRLVYENLGLFTEEKLDYYEKQKTRGKEFFVD
ncbi:MAG: CHAT domain-containing protein, partial [Okeania sp. SIO2D1]|nr:CHAT domain-containing protein [Okeania sp. SIO2D1]